MRAGLLSALLLAQAVTTDNCDRTPSKAQPVTGSVLVARIGASSVYRICDAGRLLYVSDTGTASGGTALVYAGGCEDAK